MAEIPDTNVGPLSFASNTEANTDVREEKYSLKHQ